MVRSRYRHAESAQAGQRTVSASHGRLLREPVTRLLAIVRRDYETSFTKTDGQETDCPADRYVHLPERGRQRRGVTVRGGGGTEAGEKSVALTQSLVLSNSGLFTVPAT